MIAVLDVGSLDGCPSGAVSDLFLPNVPRMSCEGMVERGTIDVLRVRRKVIADRCRKIDIRTVRHGFAHNTTKVCLSENIRLDFFR